MIKELNKTTPLVGKSGKEYVFNLYSFEEFSDLVSELKESRAAVYLFTKRYKAANKYKHFRIYLGETGDISQRYSGHHKEDCIMSHGANCIGFWWAPEDEEKRKDAESDLLEAYNFPCNEKENS